MEQQARARKKMYQSQLIDALSEKSKALNEVLANLKKNGGNKTVSLKDGTQITGESGNNGFTFIIKRNNTVVKKQSYKSLPSTNTLQSDFKTALEASILGDAKIKQSSPAKQELTAKRVRMDLRKAMKAAGQTPTNPREFDASPEPDINMVLRRLSRVVSIVYEGYLGSEKNETKVKDFMKKVLNNAKALPYLTDFELKTFQDGRIVGIYARVKDEYLPPK